MITGNQSLSRKSSLYFQYGRSACHSTYPSLARAINNRATLSLIDAKYGSRATVTVDQLLINLYLSIYSVYAAQSTAQRRPAN